MMMLRAAGLFLIAMGIIWALQGAGLLAWPANSFMLGQGEWVLRGFAMIASGRRCLHSSSTGKANHKRARRNAAFSAARQFKPEQRPSARCALHSQTAIHRFGQTARDVEAEA